MVVAGFASATIGLVAFTSINGLSGVPAVAGIGTAVLVAAGLVLPVTGMIRLRDGVDRAHRAARTSLTLQALGLSGLLLGVIPIAVSSSLLPRFVGAAVVAGAAVVTLAGTLLLRRHRAEIGAAPGGGAAYLILGIALIFAGVGVILGSNIAAAYSIISDEGNTIAVDAGATLAACGSVIAATSFFALRPRVTRERGPSAALDRE